MIIEAFVLIAIIIALVCVLHLVVQRRTKKYFKSRRIPMSKEESVFVGIHRAMTKNIAEIIEIMYKSNENQRLFGFLIDSKPVLFVRDPSQIKQIAIKDFDHFMDHKPFIDRKIDPFFGNTLVSLEGQKWREMRSILSPAFTGSKMRLMFELVCQCGEQMTSYFKEQCRNPDLQPYDMKEIFSKVTNDMIATCAFGVKCDSLRDPTNEFFTIGKKVMTFASPSKMFKFIVARMLPACIASKLFDLKLIDDKTKSIFTEIILSTMRIREEKQIVRPDMINMLMELKKGQLKVTKETDNIDSIATADDHEKHSVGSQRVWSDDELIPQCFIFFLAGFETSSSALTFTAYELAVNPHVQDKLRKEIDDVDTMLSGKPLTYDCIQNMRYLDMVIAESLRKWPPGFLAERSCVKDYEFTGDDDVKFTLEKGGTIWIPIYAWHRDPKYFPDPDIFDPERFSQENKSNIDFNAYIPFGVGPRNCIGSRFALMESKVIFYYLLLNFSLEVCEKTQVPLKLKKTLAGLIPEKVMIVLKPRNK